MDNADLSPLVAARHVAATGGPLRSLDLSTVKEMLRAAAARDPLPRCPICATPMEAEAVEGDLHDCGGALVREDD